MKVEVINNDKAVERVVYTESKFSIQTKYDCEFNAHYSISDNQVTLYMDTGSNTTTKIVLSLDEWRALQKLQIDNLPPANLPDPFN